MSIKELRVETASDSPPAGVGEDSVEQSESTTSENPRLLFNDTGDDDEVTAASEDEAIEDLIVAFLGVVPEPTDEQVHQLAEACGIDPNRFEEVLYGFLRKLTGNEGDSTEVGTASEEDIDESLLI